jgi:hypothetical protein
MNLSLATLVEEVRKVAAAEPDRKYGCVSVEGEVIHSCFYNEHPQKTGTPTACLIGKALKNLGVSVNQSVDSQTPGVVELLREHLEVEEAQQPGPALTWLSDVQGRQDMGNMWADAVAWADARII